jgi:hypothetical protein
MSEGGCVCLLLERALGRLLGGLSARGLPVRLVRLLMSHLCLIGPAAQEVLLVSDARGK